MVRNQFFKMAIVGTCFLYAGQAAAVCMSDNNPSVLKERRTTAAIIEGEALHAQELKEDPNDPAAVTATIYDVRVVHAKRGRVAGTIQVRSDNAKSHFPMQVGRNYMLFLKRDGKLYTVDSCSNSGKMAEKRQIKSSIVPDKRKAR